jgi:hypothetical protein
MKKEEEKKDPTPARPYGSIEAFTGAQENQRCYFQLYPWI